MPDEQLLWTAKPPVPRQPKPGERVWTMRKGDATAHAELRGHGEWGWEWQFFRDGSFLWGQRCTLRAQALALAEERRQELEREAWTLDEDGR